jgi:hypothetical protein
MADEKRELPPTSRLSSLQACETFLNAVARDLSGSSVSPPPSERSYVINVPTGQSRVLLGRLRSGGEKVVRLMIRPWRRGMLAPRFGERFDSDFRMVSVRSP